MTERFKRLPEPDPEPFRVDDEQVKDALDELEQDTVRDTGVSKISGGFARADIFDFDAHYFDVELKWGVQSDCENRVNTELYKMDRLTLKLEDA